MEPELKNDFNCKLSKIGVYSFGIFFKSFDTEINKNKKFKFITVNYKSPFDTKIQSLIKSCIDSDPNKRPTFSEICDMIENEYGDFKFTNKF